MAEPAPHGTRARYQQETKTGDPCRAAGRAYTLSYRRRTGRNQRAGCARGLGWPYADPALTRILAGQAGP